MGTHEPHDDERHASIAVGDRVVSTFRTGHLGDVTIRGLVVRFEEPVTHIRSLFHDFAPGVPASNVTWPIVEYANREQFATNPELFIRRDDSGAWVLPQTAPDAEMSDSAWWLGIA
jgi:hypothetical protein